VNTLPTILFALLLQLRLEGPPIVDRTILVHRTGETVMSVTARTPHASWRTAGRESAVLAVFVDGRYNQDIVLFNGDTLGTHRVFLGSLAPGRHRLVLALNRDLSAPGVTPWVEKVSIQTVAPGDPLYDCVSTAPVIHARSNSIGRFTDVPLLMYCERIRQPGGDGFPKDAASLRYTVIFSNEDGGTRTAALMARWGRTTDIEWIYEVTRNSAGTVIREVYQGINHKTRIFEGRKEAGHPLLWVASDNNNFDDRGESTVRLAPLPVIFDATGRSREEVMDRHPWTYRIMTDELRREGKLDRPAPPPTALTEAATDEALSTDNEISDPREYLYIDATVRLGNAAVRFDVKLKADDTLYSSDLGQRRLRIDRSGYVRAAVRLPRRIQLRDVEQIGVRCDATNPSQQPWCILDRINKAFLLDENYAPGRPGFSIRGPLRLRPGETMILGWKQK
jgi:hypothetical protein